MKTKDVFNFLENKTQYPITQSIPANNPDHGPLLSVNTKTDSCIPINNEEMRRKSLNPMIFDNWDRSILSI